VWYRSTVWSLTSYTSSLKRRDNTSGWGCWLLQKRRVKQRWPNPQYIGRPLHQTMKSRKSTEFLVFDSALLLLIATCVCCGSAFVCLWPLHQASMQSVQQQICPGKPTFQLGICCYSVQCSGCECDSTLCYNKNVEKQYYLDIRKISPPSHSCYLRTTSSWNKWDTILHGRICFTVSIWIHVNIIGTASSTQTVHVLHFYGIKESAKMAIQ